MESLDSKNPQFVRFPHGVFGRLDGARGKRQGFRGRDVMHYKVIVLEVIYEDASDSIKEAIISYRGKQWRLSKFGKVYRIGYGPHGTHKTVTLCTDSYLIIR